MTDRFGFWCAALFIVIATAATAAPAEPLTANDGAAHLDTYHAKDGKTYFALSIQPTAVDTSSLTTDIVILFDTSASQSGRYRTAALSALQRLLGKIGDNDTVKLMAVDVDANAMTESFVAPRGKQMTDALARLSRRVPLGSTDMSKALQGALESFGEPGSNRRAVVYIGDGLSTANTLTFDGFRSAVASCVQKQLPVNSYVVGPNPDTLFLAALANQTGGRLLVDGADITPEIAANHLVAAIEAVVVWPEDVHWPAGVEAYPKPLQPLRTDRDNIVVGKGTNIAGSTVDLQGIVDGKILKFRFNLPAAKSDTANSYLANLVDNVAKNDGQMLPTLGTAGLGKIRELLSRDIDTLNRLAKTATAVNDHEAAARLAGRAQQLDPEDPDASALVGDATRGQHEMPTGRAGPLSAADHSLLDDYIAKSGDGIDKVRERQQIITDAVKADVAQELEKANRLMDSDPKTAEANLKLRLESIRGVADLDPDVRLQLENQLKSGIRLAATRKIELDREQQEQEAVLAQRLERQRRVTDIEREQQKITQLMARFDSLMKEDRYLDAEQVVLEVEQETKKNTLLADPGITAASHYSHNKMVYEEYLATIEKANRMRSRAYLDVERAGIPMPDDPPIVYPDAEEWEQLTLRRQEYAAVDLQDTSEAEKKIIKELDEPTKMDFEEEPLDLVIDYLKDYHGIGITLDGRPLEEEIGVTSDTPVTISVSGISFRSALKLMLRKIDPALTYTIQDEVLLITTKEASAEQLTTKVYPVADLVLPITLNTTSVGGFGSNMGQQGMMGFGGMGGGQSAGMGGMGGGGMGGMGGGGMGGMGGMGGGGMGGGGGMFSDQRLKTDIEPIGTSPSGITVYRFRYRGGQRLYQGVMAQELIETHPAAVVLMPNGYYGVRYDRIDVDFIEVGVNQQRNPCPVGTD